MKCFGLIGYPLGHSFSADWFAQKFAREGIADCRYDLCELSSIEELPTLLAATPDLVGFNVTIPYKQQILPYLDELSPEAEAIGAVNCVWREGTQGGRSGVGRLVGYNTDAEGFRHTLDKITGTERPNSALVLGTGGASKAVQYVLRQKGIPCKIVSRDAAKGDYTYPQVTREVIKSNLLIINTSPIGMYPHADDAPSLPYAALTPAHTLIDLIYNPAETLFLQRGKARGARTCNGLDMLHRQAELSCEKFKIKS